MAYLGPWIAALVLAAAQPADPSAPDAWIEQHLDEVVILYQQLHAHPELSGREVETARRMAEELRNAGAEVTTGVGRLGVVGVLKNGRGPTVLVRTEMDALPVTEATGLPYASRATDLIESGKTVGLMHACGHDLHMANLVGTARWLADQKNRWSGTVVLIAQPAEESAQGARRMLADGLYTRFPRPDFALALHVAHDLEAGKVGYCPGPAMAGTTSVTIVVRGRGGHGALPQTTVDPIVLASALVLDLQTIVSRELNPLDPAVVTVGSFQAGEESNIIPDEARLHLTLRWFRPEVRDQLVEALQRRAVGLARAHNAPAPLVIVGGGVPPLVNSPVVVARLVPVWARGLGVSNVVEVPPTMIAEDFGSFAEPKVATLMFRLGSVSADRMSKARAGAEPLPSLHSPLYAPDPVPTLRTGIRAMTAAVVELLPPVFQ